MRARASDDISTTEGVRSKLRSRSTETLLIYHLLSRFFFAPDLYEPNFWRVLEVRRAAGLPNGGNIDVSFLNEAAFVA